MRLSDFVVCVVAFPAFLIGQSAPARVSVPPIPKAWNDVAVKSYELPLSFGKHAEYLGASEYYAIPARTIYQTYPIYRPDKEPRGYMNWLRAKTPRVIFDPAKLHTEAEWIKAGATVFDSPNVIADLNELPVRDPAWYREAAVPVTKDGTVPWLSYVVRKKGVVELGFDSCGMCHTRVLADGSVIRGAQGNFPWHSAERYRYEKQVRGHREREEAVLAEYRRECAAPWAQQTELEMRDAGALMDVVGRIPPGVFIRHGTRPAYPARIPDLIGIKDRHYLDSTGLGQHRGIGDLMRYAITNQTTDRIAKFNGLQPWPPAEWIKVIEGRYSDEQLYALALFIYSLKPPQNPNRFDDTAKDGQRVFEREGCPLCHTPPLYTNNKLTPALGFSVPEDHKKAYAILPVVVGTDPNSALTTRRGTGYYKVPSLKGVWYRGPFEHNGSVARLEDWFNPDRLHEDYVPTAFKGYSGGTRAVKGHEFGLRLSARDKQALIAFLKTL